MMRDALEPMYTVKQIADYLQFKPTTVQAWIRNGELFGVRFGRQYLISASTLREFLEAHTVNNRKEINA